MDQQEPDIELTPFSTQGHQMAFFHSSSARSQNATNMAQFDALVRKNLTLQSRRWVINILLLAFPLVLSGFLKLIDVTITNIIKNDPETQCGCLCLEWKHNKTSAECPFENDDCECRRFDKKVCGTEYSNANQIVWCSIDHPDIVQAFMQTPFANMRARQPIEGGAPRDCKNSRCPALTLATGGATDDDLNALTKAMLPKVNSSYLGTPTETQLTYYREAALDGEDVVYLLSETCEGVDDKELMRRFEELTNSTDQFNDLECAPMSIVNRDSADIIEQQIYDGWEESSLFENETNQYLGAVDFKDTSLEENAEKFSASIYLNFTSGGTRQPPEGPRLVGFIHYVANSFLQSLNINYTVSLDGVRETPKAESELTLNFSTLIGPIFYMWIFQLAFPLILPELVYEKESRLRQMMKLQGLSEVAYLSTIYLYHIVFYIIYAFCVFLLGVALGLPFFLENDLGLQVIFYLLYGVLQVSFAFTIHHIFSSTKAAIVSSYLYVFGLSLVAANLLGNWLEAGVSEVLLIFFELIPAFGLYRGLYEFSQYAFLAGYENTSGMRWSNLNDSGNGLRAVLIIFALEIVIFTTISLIVDSDAFRTYCSETYKSMVSKMKNLSRKTTLHTSLLPVNSPSSSSSFTDAQNSNIVPNPIDEPDDVRLERHQTLNPEPAATNNPNGSTPEEPVIRVLELRKVYPSQGGRPDKVAVDKICFSVHNGECFGLLGPNGAGKSTTFNMLCGFIEPTDGDAIVCGHSIVSDRNKLDSLIGVCPQDNLLWSNLTIKEHLLFFGRLKNLSGVELEQAVADTLKQLNLTKKADIFISSLSGGMKRRVSVGISLIGYPLACYLDEPSTGLDPASRKTLWAAIKKAKRSKGMILTTHSMEEAEELCDRIGIVVNGRLRCIGSPQELSSRFGSKLILSATLKDDADGETLDLLIKNLCPSAELTFDKYRTHKYDIPKGSVRLIDVFTVLEEKSDLLDDWTVSTPNMEDVFLSVVGSTVIH